MENDRVEVEKRARIRSHHDLKVWQLGMEIALDVYRHTQSFPKEEIYSVTNQMHGVLPLCRRTLLKAMHANPQRSIFATSQSPSDPSPN